MTDATSFRRADIDLANWRERPYSVSTFQQVAEFVPSAQIEGARRQETPPLNLGDFASLSIAGVDGEERRLPDFLAESHSDALVVMRGGAVIAEWHAAHTSPLRPHIVFSISKSFTGLLGGILDAEGKLSFDQMVTDFVPEAAGSAYGDLKLRDLFNMTVAIDFEESYLDATGDFDRYRRAMLWKPARVDEETLTLRELLCRLPRAAHAHGARHAYRSPNADMAGIVVEMARASAMPNC